MQLGEIKVKVLAKSKISKSLSTFSQAIQQKINEHDLDQLKNILLEREVIISQKLDEMQPIKDSHSMTINILERQLKTTENLIKKLN